MEISPPYKTHMQASYPHVERSGEAMNSGLIGSFMVSVRILSTPHSQHQTVSIPSLLELHWVDWLNGHPKELPPCHHDPKSSEWQMPECYDHASPVHRHSGNRSLLNSARTEGEELRITLPEIITFKFFVSRHFAGKKSAANCAVEKDDDSMLERVWDTSFSISRSKILYGGWVL